MLADDSEASADSEAWDRLGEFVERDPYTPGAFRFRHALFRDAAYEGLSYKRRGELHAKVGEAYERLEGEGRGEFAELLSLHFFHAGDAEKSYRYSLVAGERAQAKFANVEAAVFYRRALDLAPQLELDPAELARVWEAVGDVSELAGLYADAEEAYAQARELDEHPRLLLKEGVIRERFGRYAEALRWYNRGLRSLDGLEPDEQARMRSELGARVRGRARPPGRVRRRRRLVQARRRGGRPGRRPAGDRARLLPDAPRVHLEPQPRACGAARARAADLRGARRPARAGERAQQPRRRRVLRRPLAGGARPLRPQQGAARADRRRGRRGDDHEQHRRDQVRPGLPDDGGRARRGGARGVRDGRPSPAADARALEPRADRRAQRRARRRAAAPERGARRSPRTSARRAWSTR